MADVATGDLARLPNQLRPVARIDLDVLQAALAERYVEPFDRLQKFSDGHKRFAEKFANAIPTDDEAQKAADWLKKQIRPLADEASGFHELEKHDVLEAGRVVDRFFNQIRDEVAVITASIRGVLTRYKDEQDRLQRAAIAAEAKRRQEEAERLAKQAERQRDEDLMSTALAREQEAANLTAQAEAPVLRSAPIRGSFGGTVSTRVTWNVEVEDITKVPANLLLLNERAALAMVRSAPKKDGVPQIAIPGLRIVQTRSVV